MIGNRFPCGVLIGQGTKPLGFNKSGSGKIAWTFGELVFHCDHSNDNFPQLRHLTAFYLGDKDDK